MRQNLRISVALAIGLLLCIGADAPQPVFVKADAIDVLTLLPDPPSRDSAEAQRELDLSLQLQESRTAEDIARAKSEDKLTVFVFADIVGSWFKADNCPKTAALFTQLDADSKFFSNLGEQHWNRQRPPLMNDKITPVVTLDKKGSYPSGHSTRGMLFSQVLSQLFPEKREALLERGRQIGWDRVIGGVHYPSDVFAGRTLGQALAQKILANPDFLSDLEKVKVELDAARTSSMDSTAQNGGGK